MVKRWTEILTDTCRGNSARESEWELDSGNFSPAPDPPWSVRRRPLHGGKQEGVELLELDNGRMSLTIVPTRGMNVLHAHCDGIRLGFDSPVHEVVHPRWIQHETRGGRGWLEGFNELMCRCGLENTGASGYDLIPGGAEEEELFLPLHGRISNTPARRVWFRCELEPPYRLTVGGEVRDARMFGPSYSLVTEISTLPGASEFEIHDEIAVAGGKAAELELLYHCNFGTPVLGDGSRLVAPVKTMTARDKVALEGLGEWDRFGPPQAGFEEQCYYFTLYGDDQGRTTVALVEPQRQFAVRAEFPLDRLPAFTLWKNTEAEADGYVAGLEPGTDYPNPRRFERDKGRVVRLEPGRPFRSGITIGLTGGSGNVGALCEKIDQMAVCEPDICSTIDGEFAPVVADNR